MTDQTGPANRPAFFRKPAETSAPVGPAVPPPVAPPPPPPMPPPPAPPSWSAAPTGPGGLAEEAHRLVFHGNGGSLFGIHIVNVLLTIVTLGVYYFWAKSRVRAYLSSQSEFEGDRFAWHGTGKEMLFGFLKAVLVFGLPIFVLSMVRDVLDVPEVFKMVAALLVPLLVAVLFPLGMVGARRYRLSRMSWRGIRFSFRGRTREFIRLFVIGSILIAITFGLYYPVFDTRRYGFMTSHAWFGNRRFHFDGRGRDLFWPFVAMVVLVLPTLGLAIFWYLARRRRYFWGHTTVGAARFRSTVTGGRLFWLIVSNIVLLVITLGLIWPWVKVRSVRFTFRYLSLHGPLDLESIEQDAQAASTMGEGLAGLLDSGSGFDFS